MTNDLTPRQAINEKFVLQTGLSNFEQLVGSLDEPSDQFGTIVYTAGLATSGPTPSQRMKSILADRRVAKLYELLQGMEPEEASRNALEAFDGSFLKYKARWEAVYSRPKGILAECHNYAPSPPLFLCWVFCDETSFLSRVDVWNNWHEQNRIKGHGFCERGGIQSLFLLNLYCCTLVRRGESIEVVNLMVSQSCSELGFRKPPQLQNRALRKWDSIGKGSEIDTISHVPVFVSWPSDMYLERNQDALEVLLAGFRVLVDSP